jgi:exosortase O
VRRLDLSRIPYGRLAANALILLLWVILYRPVYPYLATIFTRQEFRTNQIALLAVVLLIAAQLRRGQLLISPAELPQLHLPGLVLMLTASVAFIAAERWLDINTLSATLFGLATYGLLGLWMQPRRWRQGLPAALLLVGVLPFGEHMETFIGYPLRLATARMVSSGLGFLGVPNLGVDTILVFENGLSQVDNPCSGVKSLWTGGLFLLAATWIDSRPLNRRWLLSGIVFAALLLVSNLLRVVVLVGVDQVFNWRLLAEMLHVPLGVIGFVMACLALVGMLRWTGNFSPSAQVDVQISPTRPAWLALSLGVFLILMALLYTPRVQPASAAGASVFALADYFPANLDAVPWDLSAGEIRWLSDGGSTPVDAARWRFEWRGTSGSILLIRSRTWRAHHRPERCFTVYGLDVQESQPNLVSPDFPLRQLTLGSPGKPRPLYSAAYWLQSTDKVTEDYAVRIWDDLAPQPQPWVLVTVLFDNPVDLGEADLHDLFVNLRSSVQVTLETDQP